MNVMNEILEKIQAYDTIIIHRHQNPDPDAIGGQVGLRDILRAHFPQKRVLATGYDEPTLTWLAEMGTVSDEDDAGALVIVCDTANTPRIDDKRYTTGDFLIKIDHHPNDDAYGDLLWVDTESSSTSELIALFAKELDLELPVSAARLLYAGIVGDTGRFLYPATSTRTFEIAAYLRSLHQEDNYITGHFSADDFFICIPDDGHKLRHIYATIYHYIDKLEQDDSFLPSIGITQFHQYYETVRLPVIRLKFSIFS